MRKLQDSERADQSRRAYAVGLLLLLWAVGLAGGRAYAQPNGEINTYLQEIRQLTEQALEASRAAERAQTVAEVKRHTDTVFEAVWGVPSGLASEAARGAAREHGWKEAWQTTPAAFDSAFAARYGTEPPEITDVQRLGIIGRGRHVRHLLEDFIAGESASATDRIYADRLVTSLNNVIGWMKMDDGVTKGERQPRVDLTREWDSPSAFWLSTADTGWLFEVYAQSHNILKTDYEGDVAEARRHAADMTRLIQKVLDGEDVNGNGTVEPVKMEGGLQAALEQAARVGLASR